jgi:hypothetical protein
MKPLHVAENVSEEQEKDDNEALSLERISYNLGVGCDFEALESFSGTIMARDFILGMWYADKSLHERLGFFNMFLNFGVTIAVLRQCEVMLTELATREGSNATQNTFLAYIRLKLGTSVNFRNYIAMANRVEEEEEEE